MVFGKVLGVGLGWAVGGPIGGLLGGALGAVFDRFREEGSISIGGGQSSEAADFQVSLLVLSAAVMKADGKVMKSELNFVKDFFSQQFGPKETAEQMTMLREILKKDIPVRQICLQIRSNMPHALRLQLLHYLFKIADADGTVDVTEVNIIRKIANYLGISARDYESLEAMFWKASRGGGRAQTNRTTSYSSAYKILEIEPNASEDEVKKAYRKMAKKYHPDRVASLGESHQKAAKEKFQKVQEAYEIIRERRGFK